MESIKVTVVIPAYNAERYLPQCLDSLLEQTLKDAEFICVDDGSTDSTLQIARDYESKDHRFRTISKSNTGFGNSMNTGFDAAKGKYVTSLDADDILAPCALEHMFQLAESNNLEFVKADRVYFDGNRPRPDGKRIKMGMRSEQYSQVFNPSSNPSAWMVKTGLPGMYLKAFLEECQIKLNETPGASFQDTGLTAQALFNARRAQVLDEVVYYARRDNVGRSTLDQSKVFCICDEHDFVREKASGSRGNRDACIKSAAAMRFGGYEWNAKRLNPPQRETFITRAHEDFKELLKAGELVEEYFGFTSWDRLQLLLDRPMEYYAQLTYGEELRATERKLQRLEKRIEKQRAKNEMIQRSASYKVGRAVTFLPRLAKQKVERSCETRRTRRNDG